MLAVWLVGQVVGVAIGLLHARRRSRYVFERRLRRNGLPEDVVEEVARRYHPPRVLRDLIRSDGS
jgi:SOS response regulatory protein OraA/RecX